MWNPETVKFHKILTLRNQPLDVVKHAMHDEARINLSENVII